MIKKIFLSSIHVLFFLPILALQVDNEIDSLGLSPLFSDHMVLQQKSDVTFWGTSKPSNEIVISSTWGKEVKTTVDKKGDWSVSLKTPIAGGPYRIEIQSGNHKKL